MDEKEMENTLHSFVDSLEKKDTERSASFFTDDATWFTNQGEFKGKDEIKSYITWMCKNLKDVKFSEIGVGIIAKNDKAVYQSIYDAKYNGMKIRVGNVCTYEFSGGKIKNHWITTDRLSMVKQVANGPIERKIVNSLIAKTEKGLH
jgi:ketosteroid isomerase-like protein